jgi:DNA-binding YbaB/EbfC family protein
VNQGGEFDLQALVEQSQQLQRRMMEAQLALAESEVVGRAGSEVAVTLAANGEPRAVSIDPAAVDPANVARLEALVLAAVTDAHDQVRRTAESMLAPADGLFGGLP